MPLPSPVALWHEDATSGAALDLTRLAPYERTDGFTVFCQPGRAPTGSTALSFDDDSGFAVLTETPADAYRIAQRANGFLMVY